MVIVNMMGNKIGKEQLSKLQEMMQAHPTLVSLCGIADDATEANLSGLGMDADDAVVVADELPAKGALVKFDISENVLCAAGTKAVAEALKGNQIMTELNISSNYAGMKGTGGADMSGVIAISDAIPTMGALEKLLMANNQMGTKEAGEALGRALAQNSVLKELDVSGNRYYDGDSWKTDAGFSSGIADGIKNNGALEIIIFGDTQAVTMKSIMTEADFSGKQLGASGAIIVAAFLPKCQ